MLTFGSLFAGIGGLDLGLERAGWECRWQVEINPYRLAVLRKHWPDVLKYGDIRELTGQELESVDLICGGFPCTDISVAGKGAGIEGEQSGLWSEYIRIVRVVRPRFVLVENVSALLGRGLERVLGDLAESGYDAEWDCIPASAVGAPHRRDRVFIVAYAQDDGCGERGQGRPVAGSPGSNESNEALAYAHEFTERPRLRQEKPTIFGGRRPSDSGSVFSDSDSEPLGRIAEPRGQRSQWAVEPAVGRVADGVPSRVDRIAALGDAVVPQVAEYIGRRLIQAVG